MTCFPLQLAQQSSSHIYGFEGTTAETIFIAGFAGLMVAAIFVAKINLRQWLMAGMLFATALSAQPDITLTAWVDTWMLPVQVQKAKIHLAFGIALTLLSIGQGVNMNKVSVQAVFMLITQYYLAAIQIIHVDVRTSIETIGLASVTIPCMIITAPRICSSAEGCMSMIRTMMWVSVIWTFCCSVQFVIDPQKLLSVGGGGRFLGMLGNAQHAAVLVAPLATFALWLLVHETRRAPKVLWVALIGINLLFLFWSQSRTGMLMLVLGFAGVLYSRLGKAILLLPVAAFLTWILFLLSEALQIGSMLDRFTSGSDTRSGVWSTLWATAMESPLIGSGAEGQYSENSYLAGFAAYGAGMFVILIAYLVTSIFVCARLWAGRRLLPPSERALVDIVIAFNAMYFVGGMFEGYMLGRSSTAQVMMLMICGITVYVRERLRAIEEGQLLAYDEEAVYDEYTEHPDDGEHHPEAAHTIRA
jgi:hypothetical protein